MARPVALRTALDLAFSPVLATLAAKQPLPPGMLTVIKIAGGCPETLAAAAATTGEPPEKIRAAVVLFLQTVLFTPSADAYRILGAGRSASQAELGDHMRWLMKWLHPDHERSAWESTLALRVSAAWNDLKSAERRQRYDAAHPALSFVRPVSSGASRRRERRTRIPWIRQALPQELARPNGIGRLVVFGAVALMGVGIAASVWIWPDLVESFDWRAYSSGTSQIGAASGR